MILGRVMRFVDHEVVQVSYRAQRRQVGVLQEIFQGVRCEDKEVVARKKKFPALFLQIGTGIKTSVSTDAGALIINGQGGGGGEGRAPFFEVPSLLNHQRDLLSKHDGLSKNELVLDPVLHTTTKWLWWLSQVHTKTEFGMERSANLRAGIFTPHFVEHHPNDLGLTAVCWCYQ